MQMLYPKNISQLPAKAAYFVFINATIYHEGDQRSRDYPGHGYPAYTEDLVKVLTFEGSSALESWILSNPNEKFVVFKGSPLKVEKQVKVYISE